ncbi:MAG: 30S ribosomal protein S18 [Chloroflexi bacterium]|nr:30S ribosomal protein S18 [Chloroflexota bacterium]
MTTDRTEQPKAQQGSQPAAAPARAPERREGRPRFFPKKRVCAFCAEGLYSIDYKDGVRLRRFLSDRARILPRRRTGTCAKHQRMLSTAIKRARHLALLPYAPSHEMPA